jgi:hypothetical protein
MSRVDFEKQAFASCQHPFIINLDYAFQTDNLVMMALGLSSGEIHLLVLCDFISRYYQSYYHLLLSYLTTTPYYHTLLSSLTIIAYHMISPHTIISYYHLLLSC